MKVKVKKLSDKAVIPHYAKRGDAGLDLTATKKWYEEQNLVCYGTDLAFEIPEGYVGLVYPRSSCCKTSLMLSNSVGVIDSGYRGEVTAKFRLATDSITNDEYEVGDRVAQLIIIPYPAVELEEAAVLTTSERGANGYGSTGR